MLSLQKSHVLFHGELKPAIYQYISRMPYPKMVIAVGEALLAPEWTEAGWYQH
jgi:hypothetical protein